MIKGQAKLKVCGCSIHEGKTTYEEGLDCMCWCADSARKLGKFKKCCGRCERHCLCELPKRVKTVIPKVNGKTFRCDNCRSNCFHWLSETKLECNGCGDTYEAVKENKS